MSLKITVLCDNSVKTFSNLIAEHGFACYIEFDNYKFLLDTGQGHGIIHNSQILNKDLKGLDSIIISHGHWDHTGGLEQVLQITGRKKVYGHPDIFADKYSIKERRIHYNGIRQKRNYLELLGADFCLNSNFSEIVPNLYLTGEIPRINNYEINPASQFIYDKNGEKIPDPLKDDNAIVIDTPKGLVVISGCAHAGIINTLDYAIKKLNKNIFAVIGGTHLKSADDNRFNKTVAALKGYNISHIGVSHCTGPEKTAMLFNEFNEKFIFALAGIEFCV